jgi:hypothetical protein
LQSPFFESGILQPESQFAVHSFCAIFLRYAIPVLDPEPTALASNPNNIYPA